MSIINRLSSFRLSSPTLTLLICLLPVSAQSRGEGDAAAGTYPGYMPLDPALVVNLASTRRSQYLRVDIQFFVESREDAEALEHHMPMVRDLLITLLGGRSADDLSTSEARDALRAEVLTTIREAMIARAGRAAVSAVYFTGFIIQ